MVSILGMFHGSAWSALGKAQVGELSKSWFYSDGKCAERQLNRPGVFQFYKLIFETFFLGHGINATLISETSCSFFRLPAALCYVFDKRLFV